MSKSNVVQAGDPRALLTHLENITHKIDRAAGALRAARDLSMADGSKLRSPQLAFLTQDDFISLCDLIIDQLLLAVEEVHVTYQESLQ